MSDKHADTTDQDRLADVDIHEPGFASDPYPTYEHLRAQCPVHRSERYGGFFLLTRYQDVIEAARDWQRYTSSVVGVTAIPVITRRTEPQLPIELDPPLHSRYRKLVNPVFSKKRIEEMRPRVLAIATSLIDRLIKMGGGDLVADYAVPLSVQTLAEFTGLPKDDADKWVTWIQRMFDVHHAEDAKRASSEFGDYIDDLIAKRRKEPCGDFISMLIESEVDGHRLTDQELHSFCTVVFGAGFETTADALSVSLHYLAEHPEERQRLTDSELIPTAVEEFLRYISPIQIFGRNASEEMELHGKSIQKGEVIALSYASANRDPEEFPNAEHCLLDRSPNHHLAFGTGVHKCLGSPVATLEMEVTLQEFVNRVPAYKVAPGATVAWKTRGDRRGLASLPVVLET